MTAKKTKVKAKKPTKRKAPVRKGNVLFPGRPAYKGPQEGMFAMLHHRELFEEAAFGGVNERVQYVKRDKPVNEVPVRLHNMLYIGGCPQIKALAMLEKALQAARSSDRAPADIVRGAMIKFRVAIRASVISYIEKHIPDHSWKELAPINGTVSGVIKGTEHAR